MDTLLQLRDQLWFYLAGPALALAALVLTVRLRAPQFRLLPSAFRALRTRNGDDPGTLAPGLALLVDTVAAFGAAAVVGTATAVTLGGAGVLPYVLLFAVFLAPLRYAEVWLARTNAPGKKKKERRGRGSLATRVGATSDRHRVFGALLFLVVAAAGFAWAGGAQGEALRTTVERLLPGSGLPLVAGAAGVGALLFLGGARVRGLLGWLALFGLVVLFAAGLWGCFADPGGAFGVLGRAFGDAIEGAPQLDAFTGAFAGEVAAAAVLFALPPMASTTGASGAIAELGGGKTRVQAQLAVLGTFFYAIVATVLVMAFVGSGALGARVTDARSITDITVMTIPAESASQRAEDNRRYSGLMRILDGTPRNPNLSLATPRGMIEDPSFELDGEPADVALRLEDGRAKRIMVPGRFGALTEAGQGTLRRVMARGEMLPNGPGLVTRSLESAHSLAPRVGLAGLLALVAIALAGWGFALAGSAPLPEGAKRVVGLLPAAGAGLAASGVAPWLSVAGGIAVGVAATLGALVLLARSGEVRALED